MKTLSRDARGFIDEVTGYIRRDARGTQVLPKVQSLFTKVTAAAQKERLATVTSVIALSESEKTALMRVVGRLVGHDVDCHFALDPGLLGGMKIQIADWVVDTSLDSQLTSLMYTLI